MWNLWQNFFNKYEQNIRNVHGDLKNFTCNVCNKIFGRKNILTLHLNNNHQEGPGNFKCDSCEKSFRNQAYLKTHKDSSQGTKKLGMWFLWKILL